MSIHHLKKSIKENLSDRLYNNASIRASKAFFKEFGEDRLESLTKAEKTEILKRWGDIIKDPSIGFKSFQVLKKYWDFNADYVPEPFFYPYILRSLNPTRNYQSLAHKGLFNEIFNCYCMPKSILYKFGSNIVNGEYEPVEKDDLLTIIDQNQGELILKPCQDANSGKGIQFFDRRNYRYLIQAFKDFEEDCVIQECVKQSTLTSEFNPTSLNTFRVFSLYINGTCSICGVILKVGAKGERVDNGAAGSVWINVNSDGRLSECGWDVFGHRYTSHNGIFFSKKNISMYETICEFVTKLHYCLPTVGIVGWDIALDYTCQPVLIEPNLWWPSVSYPQLVTGKPFFGSRTVEVIEYVKNHPCKNVFENLKI